MIYHIYIIFHSTETLNKYLHVNTIGSSDDIFVVFSNYNSYQRQRGHEFKAGCVPTIISITYIKVYRSYFEGILRKGPYLPC